MTSNEDLPVACVIDAIPADARDRWIEVGRRVYSLVEEIRELPDGYALRLPADRETLVTTAEYVSFDRICCAFVRWSIEVEPGNGPIWLRMTGPEGTKALTRSVLTTTDLVSEVILAAAGLAIESRDEVSVARLHELSTDLFR